MCVCVCLSLSLSLASERASERARSLSACLPIFLVQVSLLCQQMHANPVTSVISLATPLQEYSGEKWLNSENYTKHSSYQASQAS